MLEDEPAVFAGPLTDVFTRQAGRADGSLTEALGGLLVAPERALPVPPASDRSVWDPETGHADRVTMADLVSRATADLGTPWPLPLASAAARVHSDGNRDRWEGAAFNRQYRLNRAVVAAAVTDEKRWIDEVADGVVLLCEQSSWCWPAHDDTRRRHGAVLATVTDPYVDLGAGDVVGELAWIDHLLGEALDAHYPGLRGRIRHEARTRVLEPFVRRRDWHWLGLDGNVHNWNPWIHGNVLVAALRLLDGPDDGAERLRVISLAVEGIDRYVASLPADGAIDEGYSYWWNGACRALEALDILTHATDGALDAVAEIQALRETVAFPHRMQLGGDWYVNVADGQARPSADQPWHALHRAARRAGDLDAQAHAAAHRRPEAPATTEHAGLGRLLQGMTDEVWLSAERVPSPLPRDVWLPSVQLVVAREHGGSTEGLAVAVKGGHNGEHHNHNDVGSFIVASDGVPVIVDAGRPTYTAATFGPDRYLIWTMQSSWHNVPEVRECAQGAGASFCATDVAATVAEDVTGLSLDLATAYPDVGLTSWRRAVTLHRASERGRVVIDDEWICEPDVAARATTVRLLVAGAVEHVHGGVCVTPLGGARPVRIRWDSDVRWELVVRDLDDAMLSEVWGPTLTRIDLDVTDRDRLVVTVEQDIGS